MSPSSGLVDVSAIAASLASFGLVSGLVAYLRGLFLDHLLSGLSSTQEDYALRGLVFALNFGAILVSSLYLGTAMSSDLLISVALTAAGATGGGHLLFAGLQKPATPQQAPEIDPAVYQQPTPPTSSPQSAALDPAA